jgi:hypothetical protein
LTCCWICGGSRHRTPLGFPSIVVWNVQIYDAFNTVLTFCSLIIDTCNLGESLRHPTTCTLPVMIYTTVNQLLFATTLFCDSSVINWLATSNFRDRAFFNHTELHYTFGSRREIFATMWFSQTSQKFLAREKSWFTVSF